MEPRTAIDNPNTSVSQVYDMFDYISYKLRNKCESFVDTRDERLCIERLPKPPGLCAPLQALAGPPKASTYTSSQIIPDSHNSGEDELRV